ncbi:TPA: DoxX family protein [Klebsiella pneumoniae]|uniref:DoxX family protein n=1 Tax=Klebsiella pneumoniae TaxID=573 RepID=UPI00229FCEB0|nr:DoxX family protein [Escherichia coli]HBS2692834.1 DoxX family protein [Klebsiella pneumoniae]HBS2698524.1 DoxX family protein [Klebsiella pneumoniae]HCU0596717.1 DoxX family protein [Enterobacter hormaechei]HCU0614811.1 DoxX family protein [Enterobacter bugandensis]
MKWPAHCRGWRTSLQQGTARYASEVVAILARLGLAATFWLSGQTKVDGLHINILGGEPLQLGWPHITAGTLALFRNEYRLPVLPPEIAAVMAASAEHILSFLLVIGLATRLSAAGILGMTLVIEVFVYPDAWPTHALWATSSLFLITNGSGHLSLDWLIFRGVNRQK